MAGMGYDEQLHANEELSDETKRFFQLVDGEKLTRQLVDSLLINSSDAIVTSLNRRFNIGEFHAASLVFSSHGFSWLCEYSKEGRPSFFTIVDGKGEALPNWKSQEIAELLAGKVKGLSFFGLDVRRKVQAELLKIRLDAVGEPWEKLSVVAEIMAAIEKAGEDLLAGCLVSATNPLNAKVWNAMLFLEIEDYPRAIEKFEEALDMCRTREISVRDHQAVLNNFALVYIRQKEWVRAIGLLDQALMLASPEFAEILSNKLLCHVEAGDREGAESLLKEAPKLFPEIEAHSRFAAVRQMFIESEVASPEDGSLAESTA